jgi:hypothetical protein
MKKLLTLLGLVTMFGCSSIDNVIDCHKICDRYQSCFDKSYDTDACADRCHDQSSQDPNYQDKANQCEACIDDKSCASATFNCASECAGIVP